VENITGPSLLYDQALVARSRLFGQEWRRYGVFHFIHMPCHSGSRLDEIPALMDYMTSNCEFACEPESPSHLPVIRTYFVMSYATLEISILAI
jgi:hypothetical protein